jgi:hypothetical protein
MDTQHARDIKDRLPPICPPWPCGSSGVNETLQLVVNILQHFPEKQSQVQPSYKTKQ